MTQAHAFFVCAALGYLFGTCSAPLCLVGYPFPRGVKIALQLLFCLACAAVYPFLAIRIGLPPLRLYLIAALAAGFFLYWKSLRKIVAFSAEKVYNKVAGVIRRKRKKGKRRACPKRSQRKKREGSR